VAPGLLTWSAWSALRSGDPAYVGSADHPHLPYLRDADIAVAIAPVEDVRARAQRLLAEAPVIWLGSLDGDPGLGEALGEELAMSSERDVELEIVPGSYDVPGSRLIDVVTVMDRLRSPGGCPWDAEQTHATLVPFLLEEAYEAVEAVEVGDRDHLREELGDLLLQIAFHSRIAEEDPDDPWSVDDVAGDIVAKLVRRHPHVFSGADAPTAAHVEANWEVIKAAEKGRTSAIEGVPLAQPALSLAAKLMSRVARAGVHVDPLPETDDIGARLLALVAEARAAGIDPEAALRTTARQYADAVRAAEAARVESAQSVDSPERHSG
jgi:XTP/dITP diphosphohydrolase